jgi:RimJ/RimL family protein N-acetyltransferase
MELLRTERMILRPWSEQDVASFFDIYSRDEVARWLGAHPRRPVSDLEDARKRLLGWRKFHDGFEPPYGLWAVVPVGLAPLGGHTSTAHEPDAPVGTALLLPLTDDDGPTDQVEVGWHLHPDFQGLGLATEAAKALLAALPATGPDRVLALTDLDNVKSQAVATRLGMVNQGPTSRWFGETLLQYCWIRPTAAEQ